jgi:hypothetical protein
MPTKTKSAKQKKAQEKFKKGVKKYKEYKRANPSGKKKVQSFIKEAFN